MTKTKRVQRQRLLIGETPPAYRELIELTDEEREGVRRADERHRHAIEVERARWCSDLGLMFRELARAVNREDWPKVAETADDALRHTAYMPGGEMPDSLRGAVELVRALERFATRLVVEGEDDDDDAAEVVEVEDDDDQGDDEDDDAAEVVEVEDEGAPFGFVDDEPGQLSLLDTTPPSQRQQRLRWMGR